MAADLNVLVKWHTCAATTSFIVNVPCAASVISCLRSKPDTKAISLIMALFSFANRMLATLRNSSVSNSLNSSSTKIVAETYLPFVRFRSSVT